MSTFSHYSSYKNNNNVTFPAQPQQESVQRHFNPLTRHLSSISISSNSSTPLLSNLSSSDKIDNISSRKVLIIFLLGQLLSLCITATTIFTTKLAQGKNPVSIPTAQSFLNYLILGLVYTSITIYKQGFVGWLNIIRSRAGYYILFAVIDVEGNYFVVKAYKYTSLLSAMLLDAWTIPCVVLLSVFFLKMRFYRPHYTGVLMAMIGMGVLILSDMLAGKNFPGSDYLRGDLYCILGATLYALSNVYQEFLVRQRPLYEVVGQMGFWATILCGIQLVVLEREEIQSIEWTSQTIGCIVGYDVALFIMYSVTPVLFRLSSATFLNLSLLTSDFYGLVFGIFLFNAKINELYPIAYILIIGGLVVYNLYPAPEPQFKEILKTENDIKATSDDDDDSYSDYGSISSASIA